MTTLRLDYELAQFTEGLDVHTLEGRTLGDGLRNFFNKYPQLHVRIAEETVLPILGTDAILENSDLATNLECFNEIELLSIPKGQADPGTWTAIATAAMELGASFETAMTIYNVMAVLSAILTLAYAASIVLTIVGALSLDMGEPDIGSGGLDNSASYTFTGIRNTTATSTPIPVIYGAHRIGGQILNIYTEASDTNTSNADSVLLTDTILRYQLALCEGEVQSISDIEINKFPSSYYSDVTITNSMVGAQTQNVMTDFNQISDTLTLNRKIVPSNNAYKIINALTDYSIVYGIVRELPQYGYYADEYMQVGTYMKDILGMYRCEIQSVPDDVPYG